MEGIWKRGLFCQRICEGVRSSLGGAPAHPRIKPCWVPPGRASHADVLTGSSGVPARQTPAESSGLCGGLSVIDFTHFSTNSTFLGLVNIQFQEWKLQFFDIYSCIKKWIRGLQTSLRTAAISPRSSSLRDVSRGGTKRPLAAMSKEKRLPFAGYLQTRPEAKQPQPECKISYC